MVPGTITVEGRDYEDFVQLLPIECKRLPTPPDKRRSDCEYVHGPTGHRTGAIERFKHGLHGPTNLRAMIIAYVQEESFEHWKKAINNRLRKMATDGVDDGMWEPSESLDITRKDDSAGFQKLGSIHRRSNPSSPTSEICIEHLWVILN